MKDPQYKKKSELEKLYLDTTYSVFINKQQYDINIGDPVPLGINKLLDKEKSAVILTAWNPRSQLLSAQENKTRNNELKSAINQYTVFRALGQGSDLSDTSWSAEESYLILGIHKEDANKLAVEHGQYAYVWLESEMPASLIFTQLWQSLSDDS